MEIKDLKPNKGNVDLVLEVVEKEEPRTFEKFGKKGKVCSVKVKDETGIVKLTLWNEEIDKVEVGDRIHLQNGWCSEFKNEKQISIGKFGTVEVIEKVKVLTNDPKLLNSGKMNMNGEDDDNDDDEGSEEESVDEEVIE